MVGLHAERVGRLRGRMASAGCELVALGPGDDFRYLCGWSPLADERLCLLLVSQDRQALVAPAVSARALQDRVGLPTFAYRDEDGPDRKLQEALRFVGGPFRHVAVSDDLRADHLLAVQRQLAGARYGLASELVAPVRARKDAAELDALRRAARVADAGVRAAFEACRPGAREVDVAREARSALLASGAEAAPFVLVASGPNSADPHHEPGQRELRWGEPVLVDVVARVDGYCSDVTRMAFVGDVPPHFAEVVAVVERALRAALAAAAPGVPASSVDRAAREVIEAAGYGEHFVHRTGHGLGLSVHEPPFVHAANHQLLEAGMVFTVEPGVYLPGEFGVRLEEVVVLGPQGAEVLSQLPRDLVVLAG